MNRMKQNKFLNLSLNLTLALFLGVTSVTFSASTDEDSEKKDDVKTIKGNDRTLTLAMGMSRTLEFPFDVGPIYVTDPSLFEYRRVKDGDKDRKLSLGREVVAGSTLVW